MGVTLLRCLTGLRSALEALEAAEDALEEPSLAPSVADAAARWPDDVAVGLAELAVGLVWRRPARARLPLSHALRSLEEMAERTSTRAGVAAPAGGAAAGARECVVCMAAARAVRFRCGHCVCCEECTVQLERCPACRSGPIEVVARGEELAHEESFARVGVGTE